MEQLVIDRELWWRGRGDAESRLRNSHGKMCCLGFLCESFGARYEDIDDIAFPTNIDGGEWLPARLYWLCDVDQEQQRPMEEVIGLINDDKEVTDVEREAYIAKEFAKHDIAVTFTN